MIINLNRELSSIIGLLGAYAICIFFYNLDLSLLDSLDPQYWFQRSGAILVLSAAAVEYQINRKDSFALINSIEAAGQGIPNTPDIPKLNQLLKWISHLSIVLGTAIWGYGDLLFK